MTAWVLIWVVATTGFFETRIDADVPKGYKTAEQCLRALKDYKTRNPGYMNCIEVEIK